MNLIKFLACIAVSLIFMPGFAQAGGMEQKAKTSMSSTKSSSRARMHSGPKSYKMSKRGKTRSLPEFELAKYQYCGQDSDCTMVFNGCCDCANGSPEVAINKSRVEAFRSRFECLSVSCGTNDAEPQCGTGVVSCISHRCQYVGGR